MPASQRPEATSQDLVIGIVGCGVMGRGIAQIAALAGATVWLNDTRAEAAHAARDTLANTFGMLVEKGKLQRDAADSAIGRLHAGADLKELAGCDLVIEAIIERLDAKKELFRALEDIVGPDAMLATNTSSLSVTAIAAGLKRPQQVVGFHFFNPVPLMKMVEVIGGLKTGAGVCRLHAGAGHATGATRAVRRRTRPASSSTTPAAATAPRAAHRGRGHRRLRDHRPHPARQAPASSSGRSS